MQDRLSELGRTRHLAVWACHLVDLQADILLDRRDVRTDPMHTGE